MPSLLGWRPSLVGWAKNGLNGVVRLGLGPGDRHLHDGDDSHNDDVGESG